MTVANASECDGRGDEIRTKLRANLHICRVSSRLARQGVAWRCELSTNPALQPLDVHLLVCIYLQPLLLSDVHHFATLHRLESRWVFLGVYRVFVP